MYHAGAIGSGGVLMEKRSALTIGPVFCDILLEGFANRGFRAQHVAPVLCLF